MTRYRHSVSPGRSAYITHDEWGTKSTQIIKLPDELNRSTYDEVIPGFKVRTKNGEIFNNPYSSYVTSYEANDVYEFDFESYDLPDYGTYRYWSRHREDAGIKLSKHFGNVASNYPTVTLTGEQEARQNAQISAIAGVNQTQFDLGTFVGEWSKTRKLHRDLGNAIVKMVSEGSKYDSRKARFRRVPLYDANGVPLLNRRGQPQYRYLHDPAVQRSIGNSIRSKNLANAYLLGRFGIMPLLHDIDSGIKLMSNVLKPLRHTARGTETLQGSTLSTATIGDQFGISHTVTLSTTRTLNLRYGILYDTNFTGRLAAQLGLSRPLSTMWELTPYSFIIDRFVKVGDWLNAVQPNLASRTLAAWASSTETTVYTASVSNTFHKNVGPGEKQTYDGSWNGGSIYVIKSKRRDPWIPTVPTHPVISPGFKDIHSLDYVALILQKLKINRTFQ